LSTNWTKALPGNPGGYHFCPKSNNQLTDNQARAAAREIALYLKQSKERRRDRLQNLAKGEA